MSDSETPLPLFALDFETTGLSPRFDHVLEVGLTGARTWNALVSDAGPSSPGALATHGITESEALHSKVLSRSDVLVLCADKLSPGMVRETQVAVQLGIPVFQVPGWDVFVAEATDQVDGAA